MDRINWYFDPHFPPPSLPDFSNNIASTWQQNSTTNIHLPEIDGANSEPYINLTSLADAQRQPVLIYDRRSDSTLDSLVTSLASWNNGDIVRHSSNNNRRQLPAFQSRPEPDQVEEIGICLASMSLWSLEQTASTSDNVTTHESVAENSPYGSPGQKFEEFVPGYSPYDPNKANYRARIKSRAQSHDATTQQGRLDTFFDWKNDDIIDRRNLAAAGFFYEGKGDEVWCFKCGVMLHNWTRCDDPKKEHYRLCKHHCI